MLLIQILYFILICLFIEGRNLLIIVLLIDSATLLNNTRILIIDVYVDDIVFAEFSGPSLRNSILDLVLEIDAIGTFGESLSDRLLVKFVEFIVELSNYLMDVMRLLFLIQLVDY